MITKEGYSMILTNIMNLIMRSVL